MQAVIQNKLQHTERERHIQILWAIESGSRAWGFASPDSDYDVRAVYVQAPERYLQVDAAEEGFEWIEDEWFDVGAWDLRKTLRLLRSSNAVVLEWLQSPIIYQGDLAFQTEIWALAQAYFQPKAALYHYRGIAKTASAAFQADGSIRLKKWFYVLRPLLAALWVAQHQTIAPMTLEELLVGQSDEIRQHLWDLVAFKNEQSEAYVFTPDAVLQQWIADLWQQTEVALPERAVPDAEPLNRFFRTWIERYVDPA